MQTAGMDRCLSMEWIGKQIIGLGVQLSGGVLGQLHNALESIPSSYNTKSLINTF